MKRRLLFLLLLATPVFAQGVPYENFLMTANGPQGTLIPVTFATVTVCAGVHTEVPCTPAVTLYSDVGLTQVITPPLTSGPLGNYRFVLTPGTYSVSFTGPGISTANDVIVLAVGTASNTTFTGNNSYSGNNTHSGTEAFTGPLTAGNLNGIIFVDGVKYPTLASAVTACNSNPCTIYDNLPETTSTNPFANLAAGSEVHMGFNGSSTGVWSTTAQWVIPNKVRVYMGGARSGGVQAIAGFPASTALIKLGSGSGLVFGTSIEDGVINCNGQATIGVYSNAINEESGGEKLNIINCPVGGFQFESTGVGQGAGDFYWHDIEVYPGTNGVASTYGGKLDGFATNSAQVGMMYDITYVGNSSTPSTTAFIFEGVTGGNFSSFHCEQATTCYGIGDGTSAVTGGTFTRMECGPQGAGTTNCVTLNASDTNINLLGIENLAGSTNTLVDNILSKTITNSTVGFYQVGSTSMVTSDPGTTSTLAGLALSSHTFSTLGTLGNGTVFYCPDCTIANPCAGSGTGAIAKRLNSIWVCN